MFHDVCTSNVGLWQHVKGTKPEICCAAVIVSHNSDYVRYRDNMLGHNSFGAMHGAKPVVVDVLKRFPATPGGGARVGELIRMLDAVLRH